MLHGVCEGTRGKERESTRVSAFWLFAPLSNSCPLSFSLTCPLVVQLGFTDVVQGQKLWADIDSGRTSLEIGNDHFANLHAVF